jgi:hypothetical protein
MSKIQEKSFRFLIGSGQEAEALHAVEKAFDFVVVFVLRFVKRGRFGAVGNDHFDALFDAVSLAFIAVVGGIRKDLARVDTRQQRDGQRAVVSLATTNDTYGSPYCLV